MRIRKPDDTLAMPDDFIATAETTGLIVPLGERVFTLVAQAMRRWEGTVLADLRVSVNVSPTQFGDRRFLPFVRALLAKSGLAADRFEIELTEGLMERFDATLAALVELKLLGARIAIDDFGTGYSALAYLKYFPIDTLKLDRSFVSGIGRHPLDGKIAATIVALARDLRFDVIAEGVETEEQRQLLLEFGTARMQGYLFGKPVSVETFTRIALERAELTARPRGAR